MSVMSSAPANHTGMAPRYSRCPETRAHYAHEWYSPLRNQCPGGPAEETSDPTSDRLGEEVGADVASAPTCLADAWEAGFMAAAEQDHPAYPWIRIIRNPYRGDES